MHISTLICSLVLAGCAAATYSAQPPAPSGSASGDVKVQVVKVSNKNGDLVFSPNDIQAEAGSMVQFHFYPKNHSLVQSTFANPCTPINMIQSNVTGFFSGFMPTTLDAPMMPVYTIMVSDTKPIWFYCSQGKHCQAGMVGVINAAAGSDKNLAAYKALAAKATDNLSPGQSMGLGGGYGYGSGSPYGSNYSTTASPTVAPSPTDTSAPTETAAPAALTITTVAASTTTSAPIKTFSGAAAKILASSNDVYGGLALASLFTTLVTFFF